MKLRYRVTLKRLLDGSYYARCDAAPNGLAEGQGRSAEEALEKLRDELRYRLELCPCSGIARERVELAVNEAPARRPPRPAPVLRSNRGRREPADRR